MASAAVAAAASLALPCFSATLEIPTAYRRQQQPALLLRSSRGALLARASSARRRCSSATCMAVSQVAEAATTQEEGKKGESDKEDFKTAPGAGFLCTPSIPLAEGKRVVLVRHGQSTWNKEGRIQGSSDHAVLTAKGESQAETNRQMLQNDSFDICFRSPLARAAKTADIIWTGRSQPIVDVPELREIDLYSFQGLLKHEGKERYGHNYLMWQKDAANFEIDGHYPVRELWDRASDAWEKILTCDAKSILVVAHNAVIQALVGCAIGLGPDYFRRLLQSNCGVTVIDFAPAIEPNGALLTPSSPIPVPQPQPSGRPTAGRVYLIQHGEVGTPKAFSTCKDVEMNILGVLQATKTAEMLLDMELDAIVHSPLLASKQTAETVLKVQQGAQCLGKEECVLPDIEFVQMEQLREFDMGAWQGLTESDVEQAYAKELTHWKQAPHETRIPEGESFSDVWERARDAWSHILALTSRLTPPAGANRSTCNVAVVSHAAMNRALVAQCLGLPPAGFRFFHMNPGSVSAFEFPEGLEPGRGVVRCVNYTAHLGRWAVPVTLPALSTEDF
eukprot:jgi/Chlat1/7408/Chrsp6S00595